jgi:hypothetical protein
MPHRDTSDPTQPDHSDGDGPPPGPRVHRESRRQDGAPEGRLRRGPNIQHIPEDGRLPPRDEEGPPTDPASRYSSNYQDVAWERAVGLSEWWTVAAWLCIGSAVSIVEPQTDSLIGVFIALYATAAMLQETPGFQDRLQMVLYRAQVCLYHIRWGSRL